MLVPEDIGNRFTDSALHTPDTDWHVDRLYQFAAELGAHLQIANYSRYVIDLNRPPDDQSLYPTKSTPGLCPLQTFDGSPIYKTGKEPDKEEIKQRVSNYWQPYHQHLSHQLEELCHQYGCAFLFEAHSIRSIVPLLFDGSLHDLNLGTVNGKSIDATLEAQLHSVCTNSKEYTNVLNGRFLGGYITRHYGNPAENIHAVQLELTQRTYMNESAPYEFIPHKANKIQIVLKKLLETILQWYKSQ